MDVPVLRLPAMHARLRPHVLSIIEELDNENQSDDFRRCIRAVVEQLRESGECDFNSLWSSMISHSRRPPDYNDYVRAWTKVDQVLEKW